MVKTEAQKKAEKAEYDRLYRAKNKEALKIKKAAYFQRSYDPEKARIQRKDRMPYHVEYCRNPQYRAYKHEYDIVHRAQKDYGEFSEAFRVLMTLEEEISSRATNYEIRRENGTLNKKQTRERQQAAFAKAVRKHTERSSLGNS